MATDINGATTLPGLLRRAGGFARRAGANRLASNSLLEGLLFGIRAGVAAVAGLSLFDARFDSPWGALGAVG